MVATKKTSVKSQVAEPTRQDLLKWKRIHGRRLEIQREARGLDKEEKELFGQFFEYAKVATRRKTIKQVMIAGFRLVLTKVRPSVAWKQEFVKVLGEGAAEKVIGSKPLVYGLEIDEV